MRTGGCSSSRMGGGAPACLPLDSVRAEDEAGMKFAGSRPGAALHLDFMLVRHARRWRGGVPRRGRPGDGVDRVCDQRIRWWGAMPPLVAGVTACLFLVLLCAL